jgi:predicted XRE-type DNA-binding protein
MIEGIDVEAGSGNVFADLGLADAEKLKIKSGLVIEITSASVTGCASRSRGGPAL